MLARRGEYFSFVAYKNRRRLKWGNTCVGGGKPVGENEGEPLRGI